MVLSFAIIAFLWPSFAGQDSWDKFNFNERLKNRNRDMIVPQVERFGCG
jgi:hypothetical protein